MYSIYSSKGMKWKGKYKKLTKFVIRLFPSWNNSIIHGAKEKADVKISSVRVLARHGRRSLLIIFIRSFFFRTSAPPTARTDFATIFILRTLDIYLSAVTMKYAWFFLSRSIRIKNYQCRYTRICILSYSYNNIFFVRAPFHQNYKFLYHFMAKFFFKYEYRRDMSQGCWL